jgi:ligand-binding sensor domain-containing protein
VTALCEDKNGHLWVGTFGGGLLYLDRTTWQFKRYTVNDGLPHNNIAGIENDQKGNLWISTLKGISKMIDAVNLPEKPQFINFDILDGLQGNEFKWGASFCSKSGEPWF